MTAFYTVYSHNFQDGCQPNAPSLSSKPAISPKYNRTPLGHVFWYITFMHTVFIVLAFVKVQNMNVFIHVFVKCVFIYLALTSEIAKILICKSLLRYQSKRKMSAVAWTICLSLDHLRVIETMSSLPWLRMSVFVV